MPDLEKPLLRADSLHVRKPRTPASASTSKRWMVVGLVLLCVGGIVAAAVVLATGSGSDLTTDDDAHTVSYALLKQSVCADLAAGTTTSGGTGSWTGCVPGLRAPTSVPTPPTASPTPAPQPNILFVIADDMGWGDMKYHCQKGTKKACPEMPILEELATKGVLLEQHYTQSVCSPTRASFLTGRHVPNHGVGEYVVFPDSTKGISRDYQWFTEHEKANSYHKLFLGKTHVGTMKAEYMPTARGFHHHYGIVHGEADLISQHRYFTQGTPPLRMGGSTLIQSTRLEDGVTSTHVRPPFDSLSKMDGKELVAELEIRLADVPLDKPVFALLALRQPHEAFFKDPKQKQPDEWLDHVNQYQPDEKSECKFGGGILKSYEDGQKTCVQKEATGKMQSSYNAMMADMDETIGSAIAAFKNEKRWKKTIFVFTSDNGAQKFGTWRNGGTNYPLEGGKKSFQEGGIRVPAFVVGTELDGEYSYTNHKQPQEPLEGGVYKQTCALMHISDWYPTLLHWMSGETSTDGKRKGKTDGYDGFDQHDAIFGPQTTSHCPSKKNGPYPETAYAIRNSILFAAETLDSGVYRYMNTMHNSVAGAKRDWTTKGGKVCAAISPNGSKTLKKSSKNCQITLAKMKTAIEDSQREFSPEKKAAVTVNNTVDVPNRLFCTEDGEVFFDIDWEQKTEPSSRPCTSLSITNRTI